MDENQKIPRIRFKGFTDTWEQRKLGEIGKARSGVGFPDDAQGGTEGIPFYKVSDMNNDGNENEMRSANNYVSNEQITAYRWDPITDVPAIFFAKVGAAVMLNRKRLCRFPFLLDNNTMAYSLNKDSWNSDFAKALFETIDLTSLVQVGALPSYNAKDVEAMVVCVPEMLEQKQIGTFFSSIDNLITLHQCKQKSKSDEGKDTAKKADAKNLANDWEQRELWTITTWDKKFNEIEKEKQPRVIKYPYVLAEVFNKIEDETGDVRLLSTGTYIGYTTEEKAGDNLCEGEIVAIPWGGIPNIKYFKGKFVTADNRIAISNDENIIKTAFISCWLQSHISQLESFYRGASIKHPSMSDVLNMVITYPCALEQAKIVSYLFKLDNLITLHRCKDFSKRECCETLKIHKKHKTMATTWEQRKANDLFDSYADKGHPELPVLSATQDSGMVRRDDIGKNVFHDKSNEIGYKRVLPGQFVIHLRSFQGGFAHSNIEGITSPAYTIFGFKIVEEQYDLFWKYIFSSEEFIRRLETVTYGIRDGRSISYDEFLTMKFVVPSYVEQVKIAHCLIGIDNLITLHQRKLDKLKNIKKSLLEKMFV